MSERLIPCKLHGVVSQNTYIYYNQSRENFKYYLIGLSHNPLQTREDSFTLKEKELLFVAREDKRRKI